MGVSKVRTVALARVTTTYCIGGIYLILYAEILFYLASLHTQRLNNVLKCDVC